VHLVIRIEEGEEGGSIDKSRHFLSASAR
jgi:hypothetical protein